MELEPGKILAGLRSVELYFPPSNSPHIHDYISVPTFGEESVCMSMKSTCRR